MTYENEIINHDVAENLEMLQQTLDNIVVDSLQRVAAITIQRAWKSFIKRGDERHKFANIVNAAIKIARAFRDYKMRKNKKIILYKSGQPQRCRQKIAIIVTQTVVLHKMKQRMRKIICMTMTLVVSFVCHVKLMQPKKYNHVYEATW